MALGQAIFRDDRRRRVLQDEAKRGSQCAPPPVQEGARYTDAASVENHPQITQFIPRRYRSYALGLLLAAAAIGVVGALHSWADDMAEAIGSGPIAAFDLAAGAGLASWFAAIVLVGIAGVAWMVYTLRRHRVDDYKARYRLWLWVAGAALLASADSVAGLHQPWSDLWVSLTGWSALDGAVWWLAAIGFAGAWMAVRLVLETSECRGACSLVVTAAVAYGAAIAAALGALPAGIARLEPVVVASAVLTGHICALAAVTLYARYVVLDVQGLVAHTAATTRQGKRRPTDRTDNDASENNAGQRNERTPPTTLPIDSEMEQQRIGRSGRGADAWVDGSESDETDDDVARPHKKLSKADRKRLRKQRRQCA